MDLPTFTNRVSFDFLEMSEYTKSKLAPLKTDESNLFSSKKE